jgi:uncharacterized DUF497 family protein
MEFEWDETKLLANLRKHGIDFIDIPVVFEGDIVTVEDDRVQKPGFYRNISLFNKISLRNPVSW